MPFGAAATGFRFLQETNSWLWRRDGASGTRDHGLRDPSALACHWRFGQTVSPGGVGWRSRFDDQEAAMNKREFVNAVAERSGLSRNDATNAVDSTFGVIADALKCGEDVKIVGFGSFVVAERPAGDGRNPRTGAKVRVAASRTPKFRAGAFLKGSMNGR